MAYPALPLLFPVCLVLGARALGGGGRRGMTMIEHVQSIIQRQKSVVEMAAIRQAQEKRQRRQTAETAAREVRDRTGQDGMEWQ